MTEKSEKQELTYQDRAEKALVIVRLLDTKKEGWEEEAEVILHLALNLILPGWNVVLQVKSPRF